MSSKISVLYFYKAIYFSVICFFGYSNNKVTESIDYNMNVGFVLGRRVDRSFCIHRNSVIERRSLFSKGLCRSSLDLQIKVFIALTFNAIMYEIGKPLFKIRKIVILRAYCKYSDSISYDIWRRGMLCCRRSCMCCI